MVPQQTSSFHHFANPCRTSESCRELRLKTFLIFMGPPLNDGNPGWITLGGVAGYCYKRARQGLTS